MAVDLTAPATKGPRLEWAFWPLTDRIVLSRTTALPGSPTNGDIYIVPAGAVSHANEIALRFEGTWIYLVPIEGWGAYVLDDHERVQFDGTDWGALAGSGGIGDVVGPSSSTDSQLALFDGVTGKAIKSSGVAISTDGTLGSNSDLKLATEKAVKTYADSLVAANDAMIFKGVIDCSANPNYPAADRGHTYRVSVAGKIGGGAGVNVEAGDILLCLTDATAAGNQATVGANWSIIQANLDGAVINTRQVIAGAGLTGGGDLSADRTLALNTDARTRMLFYVIDGGGAAITTGVKGDLPIPFACTILEAELLADQAGSIVIDIWKDTYANYPPTVADTITASAKPTLSAASKSLDNTLTAWTTSVAAGDVLRFNVDSAATVTRVTIALKAQVN